MLTVLKKFERLLTEINTEKNNIAVNNSFFFMKKCMRESRVKLYTVYKDRKPLLLGIKTQ